MKKHWYLCLLAAALFAGCGENESNEAGGGENTPPVVTPPAEEEVVEIDPCLLKTCPYGCANGECVDVRSDVNHCGRPYHSCGDSVKFCKNGVCLAKCEGDGARICQGACIDLRNNDDNCGECDNKCGENMMCSRGQCVCLHGYVNWDGNDLNGCETLADSVNCDAGAVEPCYTGTSVTQGVGRCKGGTRTCVSGRWSDTCEGEIRPTIEIAGNGIDDDCDGIVDESNDEDADGDGWTVAQGDCCDSAMTCRVANPAKINPGALEVSGNGIDDDCDGVIDNAVASTCSTAQFRPTPNTALTRTDAMKLAQAMDICNMADGETGAGLISAELLLANGDPLPAAGNSSICGSSTLISPAEQVAVVTMFGNVIEPVEGSTMAILSSGKAMGKENEGRKDCSGTEVKVPEVYLSAHGGKLPTSTVCSTVRNDTRANDSVMLRLKFRAPSNVAGINFKFKFFSKEYPRYVCDQYNDFFLALLDSKHPDIPADHNISFDTKGNPISVNNALFTECDASACTKGSACSSCEDGTDNVKAFVNDVATAGSTRWLQTTAPVVPGEVFTLDLMIFDAGEKSTVTKDGFGHQQDSLVLLDKFEWTSEATKIQTVIY